MDICRTSYDFNTSHCPDHQVMGQTGAVSPASVVQPVLPPKVRNRPWCGSFWMCEICGNPVVLVVLREALVLEWEPPSDNGGADLVAYRVWLRPVFQENVLRSFVFLCDSFILMYPCQLLVMTMTISSWRAIYIYIYLFIFVFFSRQFFFGGFLVL